MGNSREALEAAHARIHELTIMRLIEALDDEESPPGSQMLQAAMRFLKDNDITALPIPGGAVERLQRKLGEHLPVKFKITGTED